MKRAKKVPRGPLQNGRGARGPSKDRLYWAFRSPSGGGSLLLVEARWPQPKEVADSAIYGTIHPAQTNPSRCNRGPALRSNLLAANTIIILSSFTAFALAEPMYFTSGATIYRAESTTRAYSVFATNPYTTSSRMTGAACDTDGNLISVDLNGQVVRTRLTGDSELIALVGDSLKDITCFGNTLFAVSLEESGVIKTVRASGDVATLAELPSTVRGITYSIDGDLYANTGNSLYRVTTSGSVSFVRDWTGYPLTDLAWLRSGDFLACGSTGIVSISQDPSIAVVSPPGYDGRNGIGSSLYPYALSLDQNETPVYVENYSPFNSGSRLMYQGSTVTAGSVINTVAFQFSAVPEPSTSAMAIAGAAMLFILNTRRRGGFMGLIKSR